MLLPTYRSSGIVASLTTGFLLPIDLLADLLQAHVDTGATQRALCIIIEGGVGCGKTWAARKLGHSLALSHLQCQPRVLQRIRSRQSAEASAADGSSDDELPVAENSAGLDGDPAGAGTMGGTMLPLFVSAVRLEIVWHESQSSGTGGGAAQKHQSNDDVPPKEQNSTVVESNNTPRLSPLSIAGRARVAETSRRQNAGAANYLGASQFFEFFLRNDFGGDPIWEAMLLQAFRSRRLILIVDELDTCSADFQHRLGAMLAFDLLPQGHPMVVTARNPSDTPLSSASSLDSFAMSSSAKATKGKRPLDVLLERDDSVVLRLRPLTLAQQARVVRCALEYDQERLPATQLAGNMERVVHGMMILSQIRQMCDDAFHRHYSREGALLSSTTAAAGHVAPDENSVEKEVESIGLASGQAVAERDISGPFRHVGQCLLKQSNAAALQRARQLTCMDLLVRSFLPQSSSLVLKKKRGGHSSIGQIGSPVGFTMQQLDEMQRRRKARALKDQVSEDCVNVVVNLELHGGNPRLCFREDEAGRFVTVAPRSNDVRKRILGGTVPAPQGGNAHGYPGPSDPPKLGEEGLQLLSVNGLRVLRAVGSDDQPVFPVPETRGSAAPDADGAPVLLDELLLRAGLQRSVVWSSADGKDVHFMLHRADPKKLQQWKARAKVGDAAAVSGHSSSSIVVLHFVGRRIRPCTFVPCTDDVMLKAAHDVELRSQGTDLGVAKETISPSGGSRFEIPTVDIVCDSQAELIASVRRLKHQCEKLDLAVAAKKLRQAASARSTQKVVTIRTQTGHDLLVGDPRRKRAPAHASHGTGASQAESSGYATEHQQDHEDESAAGEAAGITAHVMSTKSFFCAKAHDCIANRRVEVLVVVSMPRTADGGTATGSPPEDILSVQPFAAVVRFHLREIYTILQSCPPQSFRHIVSKYLEDKTTSPRQERTMEGFARCVALIVREAVLPTTDVANTADTTALASRQKVEPARALAGAAPTTNVTPWLCLPYQSIVLPSRTRFMDELAALSLVFGNPLALSLFVAALQFPPARQLKAAASAQQDVSARNQTSRPSSPVFFGVPLDACGLYKSAVMARFHLERADDVDANDMLEISKLVLASAFATGSSALNFDSKFVGRALKGKISGVERSALAVDTATVLRKNRPVKYVSCLHFL